MPSSDAKSFDFRLELMAIQEYLRTRWDRLPADFWTVLTFLGNVASRDGLRFIDNHCVFAAVEPVLEQREALLADKLPFEGADYYDRPLQTLRHLQQANGIRLFVSEEESRKSLQEALASKDEYAALSEADKTVRDDEAGRQLSAFLATLGTRTIEDKSAERTSQFLEFLRERAPELAASASTQAA